MGCPPLCMILVHSGWKCVHQIDISVRCIGYKQKNLQIQFYCQPRASPVFSCGEQRCRINGLPDLVYYWASLKGRKKRAPDFDWWVPLSSQITVHPSPNSQVPRLLFPCAWPPILTQPPLIWILSFDSLVIIDLPVSRATSVIVWDIEIHSWTTQAFIPSKKQWLKLPNKVERTRTALAITIWGAEPRPTGQKKWRLSTLPK